MNIQQAKDHLSFAISRNVPAMLWGAPGIGKTDIVEQAARELETAVPNRGAEHYEVR